MQAAVSQGVLDQVLTAGLLLTMRIGTAVVTMPVFSSPSVPARVKALFVLVLVAVLSPWVIGMPGVRLEMTPQSLLGEAAAGLIFGLTLQMVQEAVTMSAQLMSGAFSFSLANLLDPNSHVETDVLGTVLGWMTVLVLLAAGLHRVMLAALLRTLTDVPLGTATVGPMAARRIAEMAGGILLGGLQLAAPVVAAALLIEVAVGIVGKMAPSLPAQIASVPVKTAVSYVVLVGALGLWPGWIEHRFAALLDLAEKGMRG